ncbi:MAG: hypothetical protein LBF80_01135 [Spirochaetaceae bacterium]|jgi:hypothetical protein|nr:hypothetical protein [Spirochaetaceae bacterium]
MTGKRLRIVFASAVFSMVAIQCSLNTAGTRESGTDTAIGVEAMEGESSGGEDISTPSSNTASSEKAPVQDINAAPESSSEKPGISSPESPVFDAASITHTVYNETKEDIGNFIYGLNSIIKAKKYNEWRAYLDDDYYNFINSPDYLQTASRSDILTSKKIVLTNAYDYFMNVVVPARSNDRVDSIEFINENRVKAMAMYDGKWITLYHLEKRHDGWKIVMPN